MKQEHGARSAQMASPYNSFHLPWPSGSYVSCGDRVRVTSPSCGDTVRVSCTEGEWKPPCKVMLGRMEEGEEGVGSNNGRGMRRLVNSFFDDLRNTLKSRKFSIVPHGPSSC